jgi:hypothetical protein
MYRSWAYILMIAATLVGVVALLWPSPRVQTISQIQTAARDTAPRPEPPSKPVKPAAKTPAKPAAKPTGMPAAPPSVLKKMPSSNTTTERATPGRAVPDNGMQPGAFENLRNAQNAGKPPSPQARPPQNTRPGNLPPRPALPSRPGTMNKREP